VNMKEEVYEIGGLAMGQVLGQVLLSHVRGGPLFIQGLIITRRM
jgi:hypothetical protein